jgi:hypothetical protein
MKKLLTLLFLLFSILAHSQDVKPVDANTKQLITPNNPTWYYNTATHKIGLWKGAYLWNEFFSAKAVQSKVDSLSTVKENTANKENTTLGHSPVKFPTSNLVKTYTDGKVSNVAYDSEWNGVDSIAPSKNAVYDKINQLDHALFYPSSITVSRGTLTQGTVADLQAVGGTDMILTELTGPDPLTFTFEFTGVDKATSFAFYGRYDGGSTDYLNIEAYNYTVSQWQLLGEIGTTDNNQWHSYNIFLPTNYISSGVMQIRFTHQTTGNTSHGFIFDFVDVNYGGGGGSSFQTASEIAFNSSVAIPETNVQSAIEEIEARKADKATTINGYDLSTNRTLTTSDINSVSDKRYVTDQEKADLHAPHSDDQDLSGLVPKTTTVNGHALTGNVEVTKTDLALNNVTNDAQVKRSEMAQANGVATLDASGKLPTSQVPSLSIVDTYVVTDSVDMIGLTLAERGDVAIVTSINKSYILQTEPYSTPTNWQRILTPDSPIQSVNGQTGNVSLTTTNIAEGTNKYYTEERVAANATVTGKQSQLNGTGFVKASGTTISYDNSNYEPAFSKNTAFNKNFGTTTGTVLEGRTFGTAANSNTGDFAPASGSPNYVQVSPASAQSGNINMAGSGTFGIGYPNELNHDAGLIGTNFYWDGTNYRRKFGSYAIALSFVDGGFKIKTGDAWGAANSIINWSDVLSMPYGQAAIFTHPIQSIGLQINGIARADLGTTGTSLILTGSGSNFQVNHDGSSDVNLINSSGGGFKFNSSINAPTYKLSGNDLFGNLSANYLPVWDGGKFVNSPLVNNASNLFMSNGGFYYTIGRYTGSYGGNILANNGSGENLILAETGVGEYSFGNGGIGNTPVNKTIRFNTGTNEVWFGGTVSIPSTTPSTSTTTGALTVGGGLGVGGASTFGSVVTVTSGSAASGKIKLGDNNVGIFRANKSNQGSEGNALYIGAYEDIILTTSTNELGSQTERVRISSSTGEMVVGGPIVSSSFTDGVNTYSAAQINRGDGGFVELQYNGVGGVKMFGNTATPITFNTNGNITASSFIKSGGTDAQFLKADGGVDATSYFHSGNHSHRTDTQNDALFQTKLPFNTDGTNVNLGGTTYNTKFAVTTSVSGTPNEIRFGGANGRSIYAYSNGVLANFDFNANATFFNSDFILNAQKTINFWDHAATASDYAQLFVDSDEKLRLTVNGHDGMTVNSAGNVGIQTSTSTKTLGFGGTAARYLGIDDNTTADAAGSQLIINAGGATVTAENKRGGDLVLKGGQNRGVAAGGDIQFLTSRSSLVGTLTAVTIINGGGGYQVGDVLTVSGGTGGTVTVAGVNTSIGNPITSITLTTAGTGYTHGSTVTLTGGSGSGATALLSTKNSTGGLFYNDFHIAAATGFVGVGYTSPIISGDRFGVNGAAHITGRLQATSFVKSGGTSAQYLMADGSTSTVAGSTYKGEVNGSTGVPIAGGSALTNGTGTTGWYYACSVAGSRNYGAGSITLAVGDQIYYNGSVWMRIPGAGSYTLPAATPVARGGVIIGSGFTYDSDGLISVDEKYPTNLTVSGNNLSLSGVNIADVNMQLYAGSGGSTGSSSYASRYDHTHNYVPYSGATGNINLGAYSITATNFTLSDRRLKTQIRPIKRSLLNTAFDINIYQYRMKANPTKLHFGVVAQEVEKVLPDLVQTDENGVKSVNYIELLIAKVAELEKRVKELENEK